MIDMQERRWFMLDYNIISNINSKVKLEKHGFDELLIMAGYSILTHYNPKLPVFLTQDSKHDVLMYILNHEDYQKTEYTDGVKYIKLDQNTDSLDMDFVLGLTRNMFSKSYFYLVATKNHVKFCNAEVILEIVPVGTCMTLKYDEENFLHNLQPVIKGICQFDEILLDEEDF